MNHPAPPIAPVHPAPGPRSRALIERESAHLAPGLQGFAQLSGIAVRSASGRTVTDVDGKRYLDLIGGIGVAGIGHSHPRFVRAVTEQLERSAIGSFTSEARVDLLERLSAIRPAPSLHRVQLYSSGSEAVESALRLARCATGKPEIVSFWGGFHGKTLGALALMGSDAKKGFGPLPSATHQVPYASCYRCPLRLKPESCGLACVSFAREQLHRSSSGGIAAFIVEPMQGTSGNIIPPRGFLPAVRELAREFDALLIADEMITGFGRTGTRWGVDHSGVEPDILTLGKQLGGGFPISAVLSRDAIVESKPWANPSGSSSSYGGNPLACAAAAVTLQIIEEEKLVENSRAMGERLLLRLRALAERFDFVGEVRGAGLFLGIELVEDRETRQPLGQQWTQRIFHLCLERGLLTMAYSARFRIQPPMTITESEIDEAAGILEEVFTLLRAERSRSAGKSTPPS
jgi:4-aminobutyrate aminotransferase-like enzyme